MHFYLTLGEKKKIKFGFFFLVVVVGFLEGFVGCGELGAMTLSKESRKKKKYLVFGYFSYMSMLEKADRVSLFNVCVLHGYTQETPIPIF